MQTILQSKLLPLINNQLRQLLGEVDEDVAEVIMEHMKDQKSARDLVEELEGVSLSFSRSITHLSIGNTMNAPAETKSSQGMMLMDSPWEATKHQDSSLSYIANSCLKEWQRPRGWTAAR
jgi:hypothetical protein